MRRRITLTLVVALAACAALALTACGTSDEAQAKSDACKARESISHQVDVLQNVTTGAPTQKQFKDALASIAKDSKTISTAGAKLTGDKKLVFPGAAKAFNDGLKQVASNYVAAVGKNATAARAQGLLTSFATGLGAAYQSTLARIPCG